MHARRRGRAPDRGAAPKEQPPRKLSGKRTAGGRALWKAAAGTRRPAAHRRSKPRPGSAMRPGGESLRVQRQRGHLCGRCRASAVSEVRLVSEPDDAVPLAAHAALRAAWRARRQDGAVRRLRDAGAISDRHHRRASPYPRPGGALRRLAYGPGPAARRRDRGARSKRWCRATSQALRAEADALHAAAQRRRRHPRRSDGDARWRTGSCSSSTPRARTPTSRICATRLGAAVGVELLVDRALLALQGPAAAAVLARFAPGVATMPFMARRTRRSPAHPASSPAPAIPARTGSRFRSPAEHAVGCRRAAARRAGGRADRPRRARYAAPRGRALPLRPRHRRDDDPGRGRSRLDHRQAPPRGRRLSRRRAYPARSSPTAPPRRRVGIRPDGRAPAREGSAIVDAAGNPIGEVTSGGFGPSLGAPIAMGYVDARRTPPPARALSLVVRDVARPARVVADALRSDPLLPRLTHRRNCR